MDPLSEALAWYVHLAQEPGWKAQAWHSAQALARDYPAVYGELPKLLTEAMQKEAA